MPLEDFLWANRDLQPLRGAKGNCRLTECSEVLMPVQFGAAFGEALEEKSDISDAELDAVWRRRNRSRGSYLRPPVTHGGSASRSDFCRRPGEQPRMRYAQSTVSC